MPYDNMVRFRKCFYDEFRRNFFKRKKFGINEFYIGHCATAFEILFNKLSNSVVSVSSILSSVWVPSSFAGFNCLFNRKYFNKIMFKNIFEFNPTSTENFNDLTSSSVG